MTDPVNELNTELARYPILHERQPLHSARLLCANYWIGWHMTTPHDKALAAACEATILGEDENHEPVHLELREAQTAISAYLSSIGGVVCQKEPSAWAAIAGNGNIRLWSSSHTGLPALTGLDIITLHAPLPIAGKGDEGRDADTSTDLKGKPAEGPFYGKDCPKGMVQIEFVGVSPKLRHSEYGWKPSKSAFLEVYVDGDRYRIDVGSYESSEGKRRGIHVNGPFDMIIDRHSVNAFDVYRKEEEGGT